METLSYLPFLVVIISALAVMFRLMHYARFYAPSYFFWTGAIVMLTGLISLIHPLAFLFIPDRIIGGWVIAGGALISILSLLWPVREAHATTSGQEIDTLMPVYSFSEFHEVQITVSPERVKQTLKVTGVKDIPAAHLLMKIRGIAGDDVDMSDRAANCQAGPETFSTPDFHFFAVGQAEFITVMILKSSFATGNSNSPAPPEITSLEQFRSFNDPGYVKVVMNFRFISDDAQKTILTTETRVRGITPRDSRIFSRYWRIIYPGSAIIRRVWLDTVKNKAQEDKS